MRGVLTPRTRAEPNIAECIDASLPPPFFLFHYPLVRPASNRTKFSVRFSGLRQCHVHFSIVIGPSTVTQCDASRQTQAKQVAAGLLSEIQWCWLVLIVCSLTISSTSCQSAPRRRSSSSVLNTASSARVGPASWTGSLLANRSLVFRFACLEKEGK